MGLRFLGLGMESEVPVGGRSSSRRVRYRCDLYWSEAKLAVEYDSDMFHVQGVEAYRGRCGETYKFDACGGDSCFCDTESNFDARRFDEAAALLAKRLGGRIRSQRKDLLTKRYGLRTLLFAGNPTQTGLGLRASSLC